ncbi:MAG: DUF1272 domain-containing protein [Alphaproteobacteria bacterium]|nr:DUF1272 domain-containing protein [Alphaproteobacteria bacterium]
MARLELRPNCELCDKDLPPQSSEARICTYECTYCAECAERRLHNVCINCGGNLTPRPIRPQRSWRVEENLGLGFHPASAKRVNTSYSEDGIAQHVARIKDLPPEQR